MFRVVCFLFPLHSIFIWFPQPFVAQQLGTGSCIPLPLGLSGGANMMAGMWRFVFLCSQVFAAYTEEFLEAFNNLGLDPWIGIEMDVAWGHVTLQYGLHRPSVTGPIFIYRVCTSQRLTTPSRSQVLTHANLPPEQVLSAIAAHFPDLRDAWTDGGWHLAAIDSTRGHSRDRSLMRPCYVLILADDYWAFNQRPHGLVELVVGDRPVLPLSPAAND